MAGTFQRDVSLRVCLCVGMIVLVHGLYFCGGGSQCVVLWACL